MRKFSLVPTQDSLRELGYYKPILDQLGKNTGKKIEFYMPTSYASVIEAMLGNWVDIAVHGPASYVIGNDPMMVAPPLHPLANESAHAESV